MFYMARRCGAWQVGDDREQGEVEFRVFFPTGADPEIDAICALGTFQVPLGSASWDADTGVSLKRDASDPAGTFWVGRTARPVPAGFYEYKYIVTFSDGSTRAASDPCARYGGFSDQRAAVVVGGSRPEDNVVRPLRSGRRPQSELNVYELMIDDFTADYRGDRAPLAAVIDRLDYLVDLGIDAVLFMPWTTWKRDSYDWGYEPFQYFAVEPRYANDSSRPEEKLSWLKRLVDACHERDIHVIMDGVFNHVSVDFPYKALYRDPEQCPYTGQFGGMFPGLQDLDFDNDCTRQLIRDVCLYWIETFGIDGIRFDNTVNFYVAGDIRGLPELLDDVRSRLDEQDETNFSMTLEHIDIAAPTLYLSNHDHSHVTWQSGARSNEGASGRWFKTQPFVIALFTSTATPMVQNGQEFGEDYFLPENDHGSGRRIRPRPLAWKLADDPIGRTLLSLYRLMAQMRRRHAGLRSARMYPEVWEEWQTQFNPVGVGIDVEKQVVIYHRWEEFEDGSVENFVIVLNFSDNDQRVSVPFPQDGNWTDLLSGLANTPASALVEHNRLEVSVNSNWGHVFKKD